MSTATKRDPEKWARAKARARARMERKLTLIEESRLVRLCDIEDLFRGGN